MFNNLQASLLSFTIQREREVEREEKGEEERDREGLGKEGKGERQKEILVCGKLRNYKE